MAERHDLHCDAQGERVIEHHGQTVPVGSHLLLLGSANRADCAFPEADAYDIDRVQSAQLASFGSGVQFCLDAHLARLEAKVTLTELASKVSSFEFDEPHAVRVHSTNVRGFADLPVRVVRRTTA